MADDDSDKCPDCLGDGKLPVYSVGNKFFLCEVECPTCLSLGRFTAATATTSIQTPEERNRGNGDA